MFKRINMNKPLVSVIMSVHNEEKYIEDAIKSILNQTYENFELIIIDDYSTDKSIEIIKSFNNPRIKLYVKRNEKRFLASSRNIGIKIAKGDYIILHDADDTSDPTRIEKQLHKAMESATDIVVGCFVNKVYPDGSVKVMDLPVEHDEIIKGFTRIKNRATIVSGTILASRRIFLKYQYNENLKYAQDWDHILRIYESNDIKFHNIPEPLYNYYQRPKNVVSKPDWPDYNILIRVNQRLRMKQKKEVKNLKEMKLYLKTKKFDYLYFNILKFLIKFNLKIKHFRN